eukprot:SAG25_NODE_9503_length_369_cov_5.155556_1_plen_122_part_11
MTGSDSVDPQHECDGYISASDSAMKAGTNRSSYDMIFQHMTTSTGSTNGHDRVFQSSMTGSDSVDPQHECDGYISESDSAIKAGESNRTRNQLTASAGKHIPQDSTIKASTNRGSCDIICKH